MKKPYEDNNAKHDRILDIYNRLLSGEILKKDDLAQEYNVSPKSIQRDIDSLREYCSNRRVDGEESSELVYDRKAKGYRFTNRFGNQLTNAELFTVAKILMDSRSLNKEEMTRIITKLVDAGLPPKEKKKMKNLTGNELFHYVEPRHAKPLIETVWDLGTAVNEQHIAFLEYQKANGEVTEALIKPVGIMCSEYYFYLIAYIGEKDKKYAGYPTVYRIDRIKNYKIADDTFYVPYKDRFEEGEFRKRIPFMYTGKLQTVRFIYKGTDINAVLDRFPTATAEKQKDGTWKVSAEVFGETGFDMWAKSQGEYVIVDKENARI